MLAGAPDDALVHLRRDARAGRRRSASATSFDEALTVGERIGIASVLTPSHGHAQRAWRELPARTVSINSVFRAGRAGAEPELLDAVTRTKVVHLVLRGQSLYGRLIPVSVRCPLMGAEAHLVGVRRLGSPRVIPNGGIVVPAACGPWNPTTRHAS